MAFTNEADFEAAFVAELQKKGWEDEIIHRPTEVDLLANWAAILFDNNRGRDRLNDVPLTDTEMDQIIEQINDLKTPLKLNGFINGKTVAITRDNPDDPLHVGKEINFMSFKICSQILGNHAVHTAIYICRILGNHTTACCYIAQCNFSELYIQRKHTILRNYPDVYNKCKTTNANTVK